MLEIMTISSKGQITIPIAVREKYGLAAGDKVLGELRPEGFVLRKPPDFFSFQGRFTGPPLPEDEEELLNAEMGRAIMERL